jgi:hypothetical protein
MEMILGDELVAFRRISKVPSVAAWANWEKKAVRIRAQQVKGRRTAVLSVLIRFLIPNLQQSISVQWRLVEAIAAKPSRSLEARRARGVPRCKGKAHDKTRFLAIIRPLDSMNKTGTTDEHRFL